MKIYHLATPENDAGIFSASGGSFGTPPPATAASEKSTTSAEDEQFWLEVKAIIGGVLGFWGGVCSLGTVFLVSML
jgi:hypothetical protein